MLMSLLFKVEINNNKIIIIFFMSEVDKKKRILKRLLFILWKVCWFDYFCYLVVRIYTNVSV